MRGELTADGRSACDASRDAGVQAAAAAMGMDIDGAGLAPAEDDGDIYYVWPEHLPALRLWAGAQTQWRHGFAGPTGLDYAGVRASPAWRATAQNRRERALRDLCVMERAALDEWAAQRAGRADVRAR